MSNEEIPTGTMYRCFVCRFEGEPQQFYDTLYLDRDKKPGHVDSCGACGRTDKQERPQGETYRGISTRVEQAEATFWGRRK